MSTFHRQDKDGRLWVDGIERGQVFSAMVPSKHAVGCEQNHEVKSPWLVVSVDAVHRRFPIVLAVPLSTKVHQQDRFRNARILLSKDSWVRTKEMPEESLALTEQVRVLAHARLKEGPIARLSLGSLAAVEAALAYVLGMPT